jgi:hypothetical protein
MGMHLNLPGGLAVRFEPGDEKEVELVEFSGTRRVFGFNNLVDGGLTAHWTVKQALERARLLEFKGMERATYEVADIVHRLGGEGERSRVTRQDKTQDKTHGKAQEAQDKKAGHKQERKS